jgi:hypothetical protein
LPDFTLLLVFPPITPLLLGYKFPLSHAVFGVEPNISLPVQNPIAALQGRGRSIKRSRPVWATYPYPVSKFKKECCEVMT